MTEVLDLVAVRMFPLLEHDARDLVDTFPGAAALDGFRGGPALARDGARAAAARGRWRRRPRCAAR